VLEDAAQERPHDAPAAGRLRADADRDIGDVVEQFELVVDGEPEVVASDAGDAECRGGAKVSTVKTCVNDAANARVSTWYTAPSPSRGESREMAANGGGSANAEMTSNTSAGVAATWIEASRVVTVIHYRHDRARWLAIEEA
jgi:hypothetical protein